MHGGVTRLSCGELGVNMRCCGGRYGGRTDCAAVADVALVVDTGEVVLPNYTGAGLCALLPACLIDCTCISAASWCEETDLLHEGKSFS